MNRSFHLKPLVQNVTIPAGRNRFLRINRRGTVSGPLALLASLLLVAAAIAMGGHAAVAAPPLMPVEEFVGPLPGWKNLKSDFGAKGDGQADDTAPFQRALDSLFPYGKSKADDPRVLYLPAGTYRITAPLLFTAHIAVALLGEHPERTRVVYDGPAGQPMLLCNGVTYSKFGRITWDGRGKARVAVAHQWDAKTATAVTYMEHADEVFQDAGKGIIGGRVIAVPLNDKTTWYNHGMDAETLVKRCRFIRCWEAGLSIESFNALDWWVWDSQFIDCAVGATNAAKGEYGGGHFHLYRCLFRGSKETDVRVGHASYFGLRLNTSIGSKRFLDAVRPTGYGKDRLGRWDPQDKHGAELSLLANRIIRPLDPTPVRLDQHGPLVLLGNTFVVKKTGDDPVVRVTPPTDGAQCVSIGNRFYGASRIEVKGTLTQQDDQALDEAGADLSPPVLLPTAPVAQRRVFALTPKAGAAEIQQAIDEAVKLNGQKPVVFLPAGRYHVDRTLRIPAAADLQLIGDGCESILCWEGANGGTMLHVAGPTRVTLRDFSIVGIWNNKNAKLGRGILFENVDQKGGQVLLDQVSAINCVRQGLVFDGLVQTRVEAIGCGAGGTSNGAGLVVSGGGDRKTTPWIGFFGSAGGNNKQTHLVRSGGNLMVWDTWYETSVSTPEAEPRYIHLTDRGNLTFFNGHIATLPGNKARRDLFAIELDGFQGSMTLINAAMDARNPQVRVAGDGKRTALLALGVNFDATEPYLDQQAKGARVAVVACRQNQASGPAKILPTLGDPSPEFLRAMLAPAREVLPSHWQAAPPAVTDLRLHRVQVRYQVGEGMVFQSKAKNGDKSN